MTAALEQEFQCDVCGEFTPLWQLTDVFNLTTKKTKYFCPECLRDVDNNGYYHGRHED